MEVTKNSEKMGAGVGFERIRRITGYLVGTMDQWNNAKKRRSMIGSSIAPANKYRCERLSGDDPQRAFFMPEWR